MHRVNSACGPGPQTGAYSSAQLAESCAAPAHAVRGAGRLSSVHTWQVAICQRKTRGLRNCYGKRAGPSRGSHWISHGATVRRGSPDGLPRVSVRRAQCCLVADGTGRVRHDRCTRQTQIAVATAGSHVRSSRAPMAAGHARGLPTQSHAFLYSRVPRSQGHSIRSHATQAALHRVRAAVG